MQKWDVSEIQAGCYDFFKYDPSWEVTVEQLYFETTDTHVLDIIGESGSKDKVTCEKFWNVKVDEDNIFTVRKSKILRGGEFTEWEAFACEDYAENKDFANLEYANAVRRLMKKSRVYTENLPELYKYRESDHSFVILEKREDGVPVVKWVTAEYIYYEDYCEKQNPEASVDIGSFSLTYTDDVYDAYDVHLMANFPENSCFAPIHLTKMHIKADISYVLYGDEKKVYHLDEVYEYSNYLTIRLRDFIKEIEKENLKRRWYDLAGMDIDKMDELASFLAMEAYFKHGYSGIKGELPGNPERKPLESDIEYLNRLESYEEFLCALSCRLQGLEPDVVRNAFAYLEEHGEEETLSIVHRFVVPHLNGRYEVGKVYLAFVVKHDLCEIGIDRDALIELFDDETHYKFMGRILYGDYAFKYAQFHDIPPRIVSEYLDAPNWHGNTVIRAYLKDNIYDSPTGLRPHGWEEENIPVRIVGYNEEGDPVAEYVQEWHF